MNNNRRAPLYQTYFPTGLRAVISAPPCPPWGIDIELTRVGSIRWTDAYRRSYRDLQRKFYQDDDHAETFFRRPVVNRGGTQGAEATASGGGVIPQRGGGSGAVLSGAPEIAAVRSAPGAMEMADAA